MGKFLYCDHYSWWADRTTKYVRFFMPFNILKESVFILFHVFPGIQLTIFSPYSTHLLIETVKDFFCVSTKHNQGEPKNTLGCAGIVFSWIWQKIIWPQPLSPTYLDKKLSSGAVKAKCLVLKPVWQKECNLRSMN